jgi:murein DD-endopeptidase MepM/ murein hydrolase activator NlpD
MDRKKKFLKKAFLPITILLVPHNTLKHLSFNIPLLGFFLSFVCILTVSVYLISEALHKNDFRAVEKKLVYYQKQFEELNSSIQTIKKAESEFNRILFIKNKDKILENIVVPQSGSVNLDVLREQIRPTEETVKKIRKFLYLQKNMDLAIPKGLPVDGKISSPFGMRENPFSGGKEFHPALDIRAQTGSPVKATAEGVVSFSGWTKGSGNLVAVEHGFGYTTYYAHNQSLVVKAGQRVVRGEVIALVGATGSTTGPHAHYEIRKNGVPVDPKSFLETGR